MDRKNAFTEDGGPHNVKRVLAVADGLRRIGEFESAEMVTRYSERLAADEVEVPVAWFSNVDFNGVMGRSVCHKDEPGAYPIYLHPATPPAHAAKDVGDGVVASFVEQAATIISGAPFPSGRSLEKARRIADLMLAIVELPTPAKGELG